MMKYNKYVILILMLFIVPVSVKAYAFEGAGSTTFNVESDSDEDNCNSGHGHLSCSLESSKKVYYCGTQRYTEDPGNCGCSSGYLFLGSCIGTGQSCTTFPILGKVCIPTILNFGSPSQPTVKYSKTYRVSYDGDACGDHPTTVADGKSVQYYFWNPPTHKPVNEYYSGSIRTQPWGDKDCEYYLADKGVAYGDRLYLHLNTKVYRCCSEPATPRSDFPSLCYRKPDPSTSDSYMYKWTNAFFDSDVNGWEVIKEIKSEDKCKPSSPSPCSTESITSTTNDKTSATAGYCNAKNVNIHLGKNYACSTSSQSFYSVTCSDSVNLDYNPVGFTKVNIGNYLDERIISLKAGQGFTFNLKMTHQRKCNGVFAKGPFDEAYNKARDLLNRANASYNQLKNNDTLSEVAWAQKKLEKVEAVVNNYRKWYTDIDKKNEYTFGYNGTLSYKYKYNGNTLTKTASFEMADSSTFKVDNNKVIKTQTLANGMKVNDFDYSVSEVAYLQPSKVYFDKYSGLEPKNINNRVDGGNKFYTELQTDLTGSNYYDINIKVDVLSGGKVIATINNDKCDLNIYGDELKYRIIDVTNPFVNSSRKIAKNWSNSVHDFTKTINRNTWSADPLYTIKVSRNDIGAIKNSNANDSNSYLGTCYKPENDQDSAIRGVCKTINSK